MCVCVPERLSRIVEDNLDVPPSIPMVSLICSYVRAERRPKFGRGWYGGRIASQALDELDCPAVG